MYVLLRSMSPEELFKESPRATLTQLANSALLKGPGIQVPVTEIMQNGNVISRVNDLDVLKEPILLLNLHGFYYHLPLDFGGDDEVGVITEDTLLILGNNQTIEIPAGMIIYKDDDDPDGYSISTLYGYLELAEDARPVSDPDNS